MTIQEIEKLVKLLNLTTSDNDFEAINAMRMANALLKKAGANWQSALGVTSSKPKQKEYRWKPMPEYYDRGFFSSVIKCKEFIRVLTSDQIDAINSIIRFNNYHGYIPHKHWTNLRELWHDFREKY